MSIRVIRNREGNCVEFEGTTLPVYWNACLSAREAPDAPGTIDIVNNIETGQTGVEKREIHHEPFDNFRDADGNSFADVQAAVDYINVAANAAASEDINVGYRGVYDAATNDPDISNTDHNNGDWYFVSVEGTQTLSGVSYDLKVNDIVKWNETTTEWNVIPDKGARISDIENSSLAEYNVYVDADYTGTIRTGSSVHPYTDLVEAIANAEDGDSVLIKGNIVAANSSDDAFVLPTDKSLTFYGANAASVSYLSYDATNGNVFSAGAADKDYKFFNLTITNAGKYGIHVTAAKRCVVKDCVLTNNGWNGLEVHTVLDSASTGLLGFDSDAASLQAFFAGPNASDGGALRLEESTTVEVIGNTVTKNLRGIRLQDCGINGAGFVTRNISTQNIESGIYLAAGATHKGCQNIVVTINSSAYNANNGLLCIGGINNKFSQNEVNGNWNGGAVGWGTANLTVRDCGLYDNNRSAYNGIGNVGDAKASIQINDVYNYLGVTIGVNIDAHFIAEILDTQVHYTGLGSNTDKIGFLITSDLGNLPENEKNIIKVDDVGFIGQDYAIDFSEVDLTNLRVSLGDNSYQNIGQKAVKPPLAGNYSELPYSNHIMSVPEVDIVVDTLKQTIALHEGVGGNVINVYHINELQAVIHGSKMDIIQRASDKIQLRDLTFGNVYINGIVIGNNLNSMVNTVNAAFNMNLTEYQDFLRTEVFDWTEEGNSPPIVETNEPLVDGANYNSTYMAMGVADGNGQSTLIAQQNGDSKADVWSTVPINQLGEYSVFQTDSSGGGKRFYVGISRDDQLSSLGDGVGGGHDGIHWALAIYEGYDGPWTFYGTQAQAVYNSEWWGNNQNFRDHSGIRTGKVTWKVGIESDGKLYVYFWSLIDQEWKYVAKTNYTLVGDNYHPVVRFYTNGGGFYNGFDNFRYEETETQATFYYIESPDGIFHYPLFQTAEEANLVDGVLGGAGTSHTHTYVDDLTNTTWYMPDTGATMNGNSLPADGTYTATNGATINNVQWNVQVTDDDSNYAPTFTDISYTIQEGSTVQIQYKPAGDTNTYNLTNVPAGYADNGYAIIGTAETITDGIDIQHVINVTKANDFGSDTGTITLNVTDDPTNNVTPNLTPWTKAIDFSGSNEHLKQVNSAGAVNAIRMQNIGQSAPLNSDTTKTSNGTYSRPWMASVVFNRDNNASNQHIWNLGEGSGNNDDNMYLRVTSIGHLYFGWGRGSNNNECFLGGTIAGRYYGVCVVHSGARFSNPSASQLEDAFKIYLMSSEDGFDSITEVATGWSAGSSGHNMTRSFNGDFTIGGRGSNRNFHGKVASMVVTTLRRNVTMPDAVEAKMLITDPKKWEDTYRDGQTVRSASNASEGTYNTNSSSLGWFGTQIWLMGDGTSDSYGNGIRNQLIPSEQNYTKLQFNSMQSNDIQNVSIAGLS